MKEEEGFDLLRVTLVICGTIIVAGLSIKAMKFLGIIPEFSGQRLKKQKELTPQLYLDNPDDKTIGGTQALALADEMEDAKGLLNDDESAVTNVIQQAQTKVNLSFVSYVYGNKYNSSMVDYIDGFTNQKERNDIIRAVNKLPKK